MSNDRYEVTVEINGPAEKIYNYVADLTKHTEWNHTPNKMTALTAGTARVGSQYKTEEGMASSMPLGQRIMFSVMMPIMRMRYKLERYTVAEITELKENELVKWQAHLPNKDGKKIMQMYWEIGLESNGNGVTQVTQRCHVDPPADSPFLPMVNEDMLKMNRAETTRNLLRLKSIMEA